MNNTNDQIKSLEAARDNAVNAWNIARDQYESDQISEAQYDEAVEAMESAKNALHAAHMATRTPAMIAAAKEQTEINAAQMAAYSAAHVAPAKEIKTHIVDFLSRDV